jgi:hypothetical protein
MSKAIRVDELMREIEAAAAAAGPEPAFPQLDLQRLLPHLHADHEVEPRPPLIGRTPYERLWARINTVVRRVAAHAVEPAVAQQNEWNRAALEAIESFARADATLRAEIVGLRAGAVSHAGDQPHDPMSHAGDQPHDS